MAAACQTAEEIAALCVNARGGAEQFAKVQSIRVKGNIRLGESQAGPILVMAQRPSFFRAEITIGPDVVTQAYDGQMGWQQIQGNHKIAPAALNGPDLTKLIDQAVNAIGGPFVDYASRGNQVELAGHQEVQGKDCLKLKVTLHSGTVTYQYIDPATHLEIREDLNSEIDGKPTTIEQSVGDYRKFGDLLFPCLFQSTGQRLEVTNVEINPTFDPEIFKLPK